MIEFIKRYALGFIMLSIKFVKYIPCHWLRMFFYKYIFRVKVGRGVTIYSGVEMRSPWKIVIGDRSIIGNSCMLDGRRGLQIGSDVNISSGAWIWTLHHDLNDENFKAIGDRVEIGDRAWICSRSTILPGVKVGRGAVLATGAVAVKDIPEYDVFGGIPAKKISERSGDINYSLGYRVPFI